MNHSSARRGVALMWVLVVLSVLSATIAAASWQFFAARRVLESRQNKLQAMWLARSAAEFAATKLHDDAEGYLGETIELIPDSQVKIVVEKLKDKEGVFRIVSDVRFPASGPNSINLKSSRIATIKKEGGKSSVTLTAEETR